MDEEHRPLTETMVNLGSMQEQLFDRLAAGMKSHSYGIRNFPFHVVHRVHLGNGGTYSKFVLSLDPQGDQVVSEMTASVLDRTFVAGSGNHDTYVMLSVELRETPNVRAALESGKAGDKDSRGDARGQDWRFRRVVIPASAMLLLTLLESVAALDHEAVARHLLSA